MLVRLKPRFAFEGDVLLPAEGDGGAAADELWGERGDFDALTGVADVRELFLFERFILYFSLCFVLAHSSVASRCRASLQACQPGNGPWENEKTALDEMLLLLWIQCLL